MSFTLGQTEEGCVIHNPAVDPVPFGHWTLRDEAAQRRSPLRYVSPNNWEQGRQWTTPSTAQQSPEVIATPPSGG